MPGKINNRFLIYMAAAGIFSAALYGDCAAQTAVSPGPVVIRDHNIYQKRIKADSTKRMVELRKLIPSIVYDLRYSQNNNFVHRRMYPEGTHQTFLRLPAALALAKAQQVLSKKGIGLKIFDAYRPYSVTVQFWELVKDERYVANPAKGSGHNRGVSVDLTLVNLSTGRELDMGTDFDNFTDSAHHSFRKFSAEVLQNRLLLKTTMEKAGFKSLGTEWWHYSLPGANKFELLDIDFRDLENL